MIDKLQIVRTGAIAHWTMNDPATRNALSQDLVEALQQACESAALDTGLRLIVLQGSGGAFCAGGSLGGFSAAIGQALPAGQIDPLIALNAGFGQLLKALCALPQILLVAVNGPAMGGGLGLVCCADFVLASPSAVFATPEVRLGLVPAQIAPFVRRRLGDRLARQLLLTGEKISAAQALSFGLVDQVDEDLSAAIARRIADLRRSAPAAVAHTKRLLSLLNEAESPDFVREEAIKFAASLRSSEAVEGLAAFAAKRSAGWFA